LSESSVVVDTGIVPVAGFSVSAVAVLVNTTVPPVLFWSDTTLVVSYAVALAFAALTLKKHGDVDPHCSATSLIAAYRFSAFVVVLEVGIEPPVGASVTDPDVVVKASVPALELVTDTTAPVTAAVAFAFTAVRLP
jgi:hypothetical protein